ARADLEAGDQLAAGVAEIEVEAEEARRVKRGRREAPGDVWAAGDVENVVGDLRRGLKERVTEEQVEIHVEPGHARPVEGELHALLGLVVERVDLAGEAVEDVARRENREAAERRAVA